MFYGALSELSAEICLSTIEALKQEKNQRRYFPPEQHHFTVCLDLAEVDTFSSLFYSIQRYKTCAGQGRKNDYKIQVNYHIQKGR
jgi:hypothetical protein